MKARPLYKTEEDDDRATWELIAAPGAPFDPRDSGKVSGWLRLAASSQSGGEWTPSIVDVLNSNPVVQTDVDRRAAVGASANGFPTMVFDGTDVHLWPLSNTIQNMATKLGLFFWIKPATVVGVQVHFSVGTVGGASARKIFLYQNGSTLVADCYISGTDGRSLASAALTLTAGAWHSVYWQYDSSRGGDANMALFVNKVSIGLTGANLGVGGTLTVLPQPTGNMLIGGNSDSDTPAQPYVNASEMGPNIIPLNDNLTTAEIAALHNFEAPT